MSNPTWLPRITKCNEVYFLRADDGPEENSDDIYLALEAENGRQYRLQLSPGAWSALSDLLTAALQSDDSPLKSGPETH